MTTPKAYSHHDYTIGWICALSKEQTAATAMLETIHDDLPNLPKDPNAYTLGSIGKHNIVIACLPKGKYGTNSAATAATWMISSFPCVKFGLMVGIGGGIPSNKIRLGDVVVSQPGNGFPGVVQWDYGKVEEGGVFTQTGSLNSPPTALLTALAKLETEREMKGSQIQNHISNMIERWPKLATKYAQSEALRDVLFADNCPHTGTPAAKDPLNGTPAYETETEEDGEDEDDEGKAGDCRYCDMSKARKRKPRATHVHYGLIASGNTVIKDALFRNKLNERFDNKILCIEMEAAGLMNDFPCLVIRGICDYADSHKHNAWQEYSAAIAAAFAKELLLVVPTQAVDQMDTISSILSDISDGVERAIEYLVEAKTQRHSQKEEKILEWLSPFDYGSEHSDVLKRWQPGTGKWLLESVEFNDFVETNKQVLFCPGIPGAGKTVMTAAVIDYLYKRFGDDSKIGIAYVYFNFRRQGEQTADAVFLSLLKQVARRQPCLPGSVKSLYELHMRKSTRPSSKEILKTLEDVMQKFSSVFVVADALDECAAFTDCRETILSEIFSLTDRTKLKFFATSRDIPEISDRFRSALRLDIRATESDVGSYINSRLSRLAPTSLISRSEFLQEEIRSRIIAVVNGMFLLAQLHFDRITDYITRKAIMQALKELPTGSDAYDYAYFAAMDRINKQSPNQRELAIKVLSWITHAKWPLSVAELQHALGVEIGENKLDEDNLPQVEDIVSTSVGLVVIDKESSIIRLVHYTTQEFFERNQDQWFPNAETYIAEVCCSYLSYSTFESGNCERLYEYFERERSNKLYEYAAMNWKYHVTASGFSQFHLHFLRKTSNILASLQAFQVGHDKPTRVNYSYQYFLMYEPVATTGLHIAAESGWDGTVESLLRDIADADPHDAFNRTPLWLAANAGHDAVVKRLLDWGGVDVNVASHPSGYTPLICAAQWGHAAVVKLLLDTGEADITLKSARARSALWYAAVGGHADVVRLLLNARNDDLAILVEMHFSALVGAVIMGDDDIAKLLIKSEYVNIDASIRIGSDSEHWSLSWDHDPKHQHFHHPDSTWAYSEELQKSRAHDITSRRFLSLLHLAVELGHENLVKLFLDLEVGVDPEAYATYDAGAVLYTSILHERVNIFKLLINSGRFGVNSRDRFSQTPLMIAASCGNESLVEFIINADTSSIDWQDCNGRTAFSRAIYSNNINVLKLLINTGKVNINSKLEDGLTPLCRSAKGGYGNAFRLLLETHGVDINSEGENGRNSLLLAAARNERNIVKCCLDTGRFDINARDHLGMTPLLLAVKNSMCPRGLNTILVLLYAPSVKFDARDFEHKRTALMWAAHSDNMATTALLLVSDKFDISDVDSHGLDAIAIANKTRPRGYVAQLLEMTKTGRITLKDIKKCIEHRGIWRINDELRNLIRTPKY